MVQDRFSRSTAINLAWIVVATIRLRRERQGGTKELGFMTEARRSNIMAEGLKLTSMFELNDKPEFKIPRDFLNGSPIIYSNYKPLADIVQEGRFSS